MEGILIELICPIHGLERFTIKVRKRVNVPLDDIYPKFRTRPKPELSSIIIGRDVGEKRVQEFVKNYLKEKGLWERVLSLRTV